MMPIAEEGPSVVPPSSGKGRAGDGMRYQQGARRASDEVHVVRRQAQAFPVQELGPPATCDVPFIDHGPEGHLVLPGLCLEELLKVARLREDVVLIVVCEPEDGVQAVDLEAPLLQAQPLPTCMHPLCIQHMARCQEEPRIQETEEALVLAVAVPQQDRRHHC